MYAHQQQFEHAVQAALDGATVITENKRASRQLMRACEERLRAEGRAVWETPDILPLDAWARRVWHERVVRGMSGALLLNTSQQQAVWDRIIEESAVGVTNRDGTVAAVAQAWQLLHEYQIGLDAPAFRVRPETKRFYEWAQQYQSICERKGWLDSAVLLTEVAVRAAEVVPTLGSKRIVVFGFDKLTPQQMTLAGALQEAGVDLELPRPSTAWTEHPQTEQVPGCVAQADAKEELYATARWARAKLTANPGARIGVVAARLSDLRAEAEHIFTEVLHPEALVIGNVQQQRAFDISLGPSLVEYAIGSAALLALRAALSSVSVHETGTLVRSPYLAGAIDEAGERARFDLFLRGWAGLELNARKICEGFANERNHARCPQLRRRFERLAVVAESIRGAVKPSEFAAYTSELLDAIGWPGDGDGRPLSSADYQATQAWSEAVAQFATLDPMVPPMTPTDALAHFTRMVEGKVFKPENAGAPVQIMGVLEATGSVFDHLWVCGLSDDIWPPKGTANAFLPRELQQRAGVPHASPAQDLEFAAAVVSRLTNSASEVIFSWPKREDDRELRRSPQLVGMPEMCEDHVAGIAAPTWAELQAGVGTQAFEDIEAPPLPPRDNHDGGTRVFELQSNCPFHAFVEARLGSVRPEEATQGIRATDRGKLIERSLELVWGHIRDHFGLVNCARAELDRIVGVSVDEAMTKLPDATEAWEVRYRQLERERLVRLVNEWLEVERQREPFTVVGHQQAALVSRGGVTVDGRIDRLDRTMDGGLVVIDYKSGNGAYSPGQWQGARPEKPQLPLYVASQKSPVSAVAFAVLSTGTCCFKGYGARKEILGQRRDGTGRYFEPGETFEEHVAKWNNVLDRVGESYAAGVANVDPKPERVCDYCHLPAVCRRAELGRGNGGDDDNGGERE